METDPGQMPDPVDGTRRKARRENRRPMKAAEAALRCREQPRESEPRQGLKGKGAGQLLLGSLQLAAS